MITTKFDTTSKFHLNFPDKNKPLDVISIVETFISYDQSHPPEAQLPHTAKLVELMQQWSESDHKRLVGEAQRAAAAEIVEQLDKEMIEYVRHIKKTLDAVFPDAPAQAKAWGFDAKQSTKNILLPQTRREHLAVLDKYIAKEQSRPEAERFTSPDLTEIIHVRDKLKEQLSIRLAGQNQREEGVAAGNQLALEMYNYLQSAAVHLLTFTFGFTLTLEFQNWGYDVLPRRVGLTEEESEAVEETATDTEAPPPEFTSTQEVYTNGSANEELNLMTQNGNDGWS